MNNTLNIIAHIYFAINLFIAGSDSNDRFHFAKTKVDYLLCLLYACFFSLFGLAFYSISIIIYSVKEIYIRTYINYGITTFRTWYKFVYLGKEITLDGPQLQAFRKNKMINRMPCVWKRWWFKFLDAEIEKKKKQLFDKYGEVTDFK